MRTSTSHPLQIAEVQAGEGQGLIGITFCPGKKQANAATGAWNRDLALDVEAIQRWNAAAVVTLVEPHELVSLGVRDLGATVAHAHMAWYHLPIRDAGVPGFAFEHAWREKGEELRAILRDGFNVLVHCKGGLGRAGTIAARLLIELGVSDMEAKDMVREARPGAIETAEQGAHLLCREEIPEETPDRSDVAVLDRARGALLGLAVGDAIGTTLEFTRRDSHPLIEDMTGGGPFGLEPGEWTDDTAMALALAETFQSVGPFEDELMARFLKWYEEGENSCTGTCFDIGVTTRQALMRFKASGDPIAGLTDPMSAGNGSLMRLAPVALRYLWDADKRRDHAARQSRTTHGAPEAVDACVAFADVLADAIVGQTRSHVLRTRNGPYAGAIAPIMAGSWRGKARDAIRSSGYVAHSLEAALWCVARTGTFADAVLLAANLGDDADTTAAITGQLAGALHGLSGIPPHWLERLAWNDLLLSTANLLHTMADMTAPDGEGS
ncbi:ADP-ribosylglycohydrolase family protein [Novosphingobium sp. ZN18A2]|uniref:ADP-ribosylglycohydrolase family protein n=1 Tax=Novosphingobium sp. ZN18A2 TaxID=3079861 RepID=UPI0030D39779